MLKKVIKIYPLILLISSILLFFYLFYHYKFDVKFSNIRKISYSYYFVLSFLLILFSIFSFFFNRKNKEYLFIISLSIIFALYFYEGYYIIKNNILDNLASKKRIQNELNLKIDIYKKNTGKNYDLRTKLEVYEDLKLLDKSTILKIRPKNYLSENTKLLPLSGASNSKTISGNENGYYFIYNSDRYGFNNNDKIWDSKEIEYVLIGDSFTHGSNVYKSDGMSSVLENLSKKSVLNLGYSGNGPLIEYATMREYLDNEIKIKNILWIYFEGNDLIDLDIEIKNKILSNYLNNKTFSQNLTSKQDKIDIMARKKFSLALSSLKNDSSFNKKLLLSQFLKLYNFRITILKLFIKNDKKIFKIDEFKEIISLAKNLADTKNANFYFIYLPEYKRYNIAEYDETNYNLIKDIINKLNIEFIDIHEQVFKKELNPNDLFPFKLRGHYNELGYRKIAKKIFESIN